MKLGVFFLLCVVFSVSSCTFASTPTPLPEPSATEIELPTHRTSTSTIMPATATQPPGTWSPILIPSSRSTPMPFITMTPLYKPATKSAPVRTVDASPTPSPALPTATDATDVNCAQTLRNAALAGIKIVFDSDRDGNGEIYIMNLDGSGLTNLTQHPAEDWGHQWSPSGDKISFLSDRDGDPYLYIMNRDGSNPTRVTDIMTENRYQWSPTGGKIAFAHESNNQRDIHVINQDGTGLVNLTQNPSDEWEFTWSPDGQKIAFVSNRDGDNELYVINTNGSGLTQLTNNNGNDEHPSWSPFYDLIVFTSDVMPGEVDPRTAMPKDQYLFVVSSDGKRSTFLSSDPLLRYSYHPSWSPGGMRIIFADIENSPGFPSHAFIINVDGSGLARIPEVSSGGRMYFMWSPDSRRIVVWYGNSGSASFSGSTILVFNIDGTNPIKLESNSKFVAWPKWTRDSKFIVFESGSDEIDPMNDPFPLGYGINIIQADGTCFTRLTATTSNDNDPLLSPP